MNQFLHAANFNTCYFRLINFGKITMSRDAGRSIIGGGGGGHIFISSCYAQLISFEFEIKILKSIVFTVCEQEYMNMCPPPRPNYRSSGVPGHVRQNLNSLYGTRQIFGNASISGTP